eukprot:Selendium_serpulae@DN6326_c1_g2_i1.p1
MENKGDAEAVVEQLSANYEIVEHFQEDALYSWLLMATAKVIFPHSSGFSLSAASASTGITFYEEKRPHKGRYDSNMFHCPTVGDWWISYGHGTTHCDDQRLAELRYSLVNCNNDTKLLPSG